MTTIVLPHAHVLLTSEIQTNKQTNKNKNKNKHSHKNEGGEELRKTLHVLNRHTHARTHARTHTLTLPHPSRTETDTHAHTHTHTYTPTPVTQTQTRTHTHTHTLTLPHLSRTHTHAHSHTRHEDTRAHQHAQNFIYCVFPFSFFPWSFWHIIHLSLPHSLASKKPHSRTLQTTRICSELSKALWRHLTWGCHPSLRSRVSCLGPIPLCRLLRPRRKGLRISWSRDHGAGFPANAPCTRHH